MFWYGTSKPTDRRQAAAGLLVLALFGLTFWVLVSRPEDPIGTNLKRALPSASRFWRPVPQRVPPALRSSLALFRTRPETVPSEVKKLVSQNNVNGLNILLAQRLNVNVADRIWAVPGKGVICIVDFDAYHAVGLTCDSTQHAIDYGVIMTRLTDDPVAGSVPKRVMFGIVPDGAHIAYIHTGPTVVATPIRENAFFREDSIPNPPDGVSIRKKSS